MFSPPGVWEFRSVAEIWEVFPSASRQKAGPHFDKQHCLKKNMYSIVFSVTGIEFNIPDNEIAIFEDVVCRSHKTYPFIWSLNLANKDTMSAEYSKEGMTNPLSTILFNHTELPVPTSL